ncbi:TPA: 2-C-methyl-D-erythritol 2,4-cyclodiphosphate synthase, partial [Neisseria gonorrhoeae]
MPSEIQFKTSGTQTMTNIRIGQGYDAH